MKSASSFEVFLDALNDYKKQLVKTGWLLREAKEQYLEMVGDGINTWHDFLAQPEVGLSIREANSLIKLTEFVESTGVSITNLNLSTVKYCANKGIEKIKIEDAQTLSLKDFKEKYHEDKTNNAPQTYEYMVMRRSKQTGTLSRVYNEEAAKLIEKIKDKIDG